MTTRIQVLGKTPEGDRTVAIVRDTTEQVRVGRSGKGTIFDSMLEGVIRLPGKITTRAVMMKKINQDTEITLPLFAGYELKFKKPITINGVRSRRFYASHTVDS